MDPSTRTFEPIRSSYLRDEYVRQLEEALADRKRLCRRWEALAWSSMALNVGALVAIVLLVRIG